MKGLVPSQVFKVDDVGSNATSFDLYPDLLLNESREV